jgi:hypothetical protein
MIDDYYELVKISKLLIYNTLSTFKTSYTPPKLIIFTTFGEI